MNKDKGFTLIELMIVIAIIAIIAAIAIPGILSATRAANERNASGSLKQVGSAEITFRSTDADQNQITDYWTADVAGLHWVSVATSAAAVSGPESAYTGVAPTFGVGGAGLIEVSMSLADADTNGDYDGVGSISHLPQPKSGYWFQSLPDYETGPNVSTSYGTRNTDRYGFITWPNSYGSSGRQVFIISEGNTMFRRDSGSEAAFLTSGKPTVGVAANTAAVLTGGADGYDTFPVNPTGTSASSSESVGPWSKMD